MAQLSLAASILQIVNSVSHVSASAFLQWCAALGLEPTQPQRDPEPPGFPHYDAAHSFAFKTDDRAAAIFDLLVYRDCIIQVRLRATGRAVRGDSGHSTKRRIRMLMKCRNEYPSARGGTTSPMVPQKGKVVKLEEDIGFSQLTAGICWIPENGYAR